MLRAAIIEGHRPFGALLATYLSAQDGWAVVGVEAEAAAGIGLVRATRPEVALVDAGLPAPGGAWVSERIAELGFGTRVVLMSQGDHEEYARAARAVGAIAAVPKQAICRVLPKLTRVLGDPTVTAPAWSGEVHRSPVEGARPSRDERGPLGGEGGGWRIIRPGTDRPTVGCGSDQRFDSALGKERVVMAQVIELFDRIVREDEGQDMVEYGILLGILAVAGIAAVIVLGPKITTLWNNVTTSTSSLP